MSKSTVSWLYSHDTLCYIQHAQQVEMPLTPQRVNVMRVAESTSKKESKSKMQVAVRVKPLAGDSALTVENDCIKCGIKEYAFDTVFTGNQESIFAAYGWPMVEDAVNGYNTCLFAYGQTGSGKTYTLLGLPGAGLPATSECRPEAEGLLPRFLNHLCRYRQDKIRKYPSLQMNITMSVLEIYNEEVRDLLKSTNDKTEKGPMLVEDSETKQVVVVNAVEAQVDDSEHAMQLLKLGVNNRETAATQMNEQSSRSHMVVTLTLKQRSSNGNLVSNIKFVDLAGSECLGRTGTEGKRRLEGGHINKSLLALSKALNCFSNGAKIHEMKGMLRESKLTRLLSENFGGNSRTRMLAMVSPCFTNEQQTQSTLTYAYRAKCITLNATQNKLKEMETNKVKQLQQQLGEMNTELEATKERLRMLESTNTEVESLIHTLQCQKETAELRREEAECGRREAEDARLDSMAIMNSQRETIQALTAKVAQLENDMGGRIAMAEEKTLEVARLQKELAAVKENTQMNELTLLQQISQLQQQQQQQQYLQQQEHSQQQLAATAPAPTTNSPVRPGGRVRKGYKRSGSLERCFDIQIKEATRTTGKLASQLTKAEMTQDYLKEDLQQQTEKIETTEMLRRNAVATVHSLQAQLAGVTKALREEKEKNQNLQELLRKQGPEKKRRMNPSVSMGRSGAPRERATTSVPGQWG
eukprot:TRINITY_DN15534_c0_g1_i6.p1 TRINITY_DN15534_c0_g1~~TRINITY_DN15534_c0_g1_i6.p1  ORF type:complete len:697 (+),score=250.84 TRINITY_DN15534_c0_g1_i6:1291-3381(+)